MSFNRSESNMKEQLKDIREDQHQMKPGCQDWLKKLNQKFAFGDPSILFSPRRHAKKR
jgi:hypothetical protein